ncbi:PTS system N-acetylgalactosamine-specific IID component [Breznakia sp. PF5-3]|uniref:PTS system mannose/fructose/sorbose family transporter subunit IID n=1 Tax=unclassified Breznakia TaxID=2623764 RepID=UPI00240772A0|nr:MULTISPECIES: PTS system mannose/fructose/sorbose family transporter subunit IID [unclassified Breznakia]MDF9825461.1 PTS system N-acetylgalactosamine-specific IID component [Breznakia sp. PM6-1]MDF9836346.1 PTS system N-acetylgalactosamine-specific IID component [Breznakia sp. PF5-3]MDF9838751.1 PTS system N-acetylgalactosamine-specific IID component [Breznakia sp. PFB2-8]MDF9860787.1 PTS system N-acetylgalactosamine-specific IID component [Breznakia sp. PH5-24]
MASNLEVYENLTPAEPLDKKTLNKIMWKSLMLQASFNYERMQAAGWLWAMLPGLEKIHTDKNDLSASMKHNLEFFNTHTYTVTFVMGIVLSLEQQKADINTIRSVRVAAMGPLGGIGDAMIWFTLMPIAAGITATMAIDGNVIGPILYFIIVFGAQMALRYWLLNWSYALGRTAVSMLTNYAKEFTHAASMLGVFVVGALTCNYGNTAIGMIIPNGEQQIILQDLLNGILPSLVPLALTLMCYLLIKKRQWSPTKIICLLLAIGVIGCSLGIWKGSAGMIVDTNNDGIYDAEMEQGYESLIPVPWHK